MQMCQRHWDAIRAAIKERGLDHLVAPDGETAAQQMVDALRRGGKATPVNFDPLMGAWSAITGNLIERWPNLMFMDGCPYCHYIDQGRKEGAPPEAIAACENWVNNAADDMLAMAREIGVV